MKKVVQKIEAQNPIVPKLINVVAYARVSSGKDEMMHSLSAQVSYYSKLIQSHVGWKYAGVYADSAVTGTKDARDEFQHIVTLRDKYKKLLEKTHDTNGVFDVEYKYIQDLYAERLEKNDFL